MDLSTILLWLRHLAGEYAFDFAVVIFGVCFLLDPKFSFVQPLPAIIVLREEEIRSYHTTCLHVSFIHLDFTPLRREAPSQKPKA
jgi:hypothetical protein